MIKNLIIFMLLFFFYKLFGYKKKASIMGVKGLKKVLSSELVPFMEGLDNKNEILCVDVLGLLFAYCHGCIEEIYSPMDNYDSDDDIVKKKSYVFNNRYRLNILNVATLITKNIGNICLKCSMIKLCVDGEKRPFLKQYELIQRGKRIKSRPKSQFLKTAVHNYKKDFVEAIEEKLKSMRHNVTVINSEFEADCIVTAGTIVITTDTDIIMFALFTDQVKYIGFSEFGGQIRYIHMPSIKKKYNLNSIIIYALLAGNDYLPPIYSPQDPKSLYEKITGNFVESFENIYKHLRNYNKPIVKKEDAQPFVDNWLTALEMYYMYLKTSNPLYIDKPLKYDVKKIKECNARTIYECIQNKNFIL